MCEVTGYGATTHAAYSSIGKVKQLSVIAKAYIPLRRKLPGVGVGQCPRRQNFVLGIPTRWYLGANANPKICVTHDANPRRQSVEYRWRWVFWRWPCIFHVYFMYISCCLCNIFRVGYARISQCKPSFQWNMGLRDRR